MWRLIFTQEVKTCSVCMCVYARVLVYAMVTLPSMATLSWQVIEKERGKNDIKEGHSPSITTSTTAIRLCRCTCRRPEHARNTSAAVRAAERCSASAATRAADGGWQPAWWRQGQDTRRTAVARRARACRESAANPRPTRTHLRTVGASPSAWVPPPRVLRHRGRLHEWPACW